MSAELNPIQQESVRVIYAKQRPTHPDDRTPAQARMVRANEHGLDNRLIQRHFAVLVQEVHGRNVYKQMINERLAKIKITPEQRRLEEVRAQLDAIRRARR